MNPARTDAHPSAEEVDATLDPTGAAPDVVEHVSRCPRCSRMRDGLVEVRALLQQESQRVHEPPADLHARIAAALGAAPEATRHRRRPAGGWFALAAGLAVVAGSAAVAVQVVSSGGQDVVAGVEDSSSSAAESGEGADTDTESGARNDTESGARNDTESGARDDTESGARNDTESGARDSVPQLLEAAVPAVGTGTDYRPEDLTTQVTALLAPGPAGESVLQGPSAAAAAPEGEGSLSDPGALQGCLTAIGAGSGSGSGAADPVPVAVDLAQWEGREAAVLVLRDPAAQSVRTVEVWVVSRSCGPTDDAVLHFARVEL